MATRAHQARTGLAGPKLARKALLPSCSRPAAAPSPPIRRRHTISAAREHRQRTVDAGSPPSPFGPRLGQIWVEQGPPAPPAFATPPPSSSAAVPPPTRRAGLKPPRRTAASRAAPRRQGAPAAPRVESAPPPPTPRAQRPAAHAGGDGRGEEG
nr:uncharacterized protein LOC127304098 [Lolium perenne]